jgi:hypothetical protein
MFRLGYLVLVAVIITAGCAKDVLKPGWKYRESRYVTAVGSGQSEIEARNQAIRELSGKFESRVFNNAYDRVKSVIDTSGVEVSGQGIESYIRALSSEQPRGIQIPKTMFSEDKALYYALAVLEKKKARKDWLREVENLDSIIKERFNSVDLAESSFMKFKSLNKILGLWMQREVTVSRLRVVGFDEEVPVDYDIQAVFREVSKLKSAMPVFVDITGEEGKTIKNSITETLLKRGFVLTDRKDEAEVLIAGTVDVRPIDVDKPGWQFARAAVSLTVTDSKTGLIVGKVYANKRAGHVSYNEAVYNAVKKVLPLVSEKLVRFLELD